MVCKREVTTCNSADGTRGKPADAMSISTAPRKNRSILNNQNYRIWDEIGPPPRMAICKSRAIIWFLHQKRVHKDLFWPENESKIYILVSFQHMLRLEIAVTIGVYRHFVCKCAYLRNLNSEQRRSHH
jgi:hypothetical protein